MHSSEKSQDFFEANQAFRSYFLTDFLETRCSGGNSLQGSREILFPLLKATATKSHLLNVHQKDTVLLDNQEYIKKITSNVSRRQHFIRLILTEVSSMCQAG